MKKLLLVFTLFFTLQGTQAAFLREEIKPFDIYWEDPFFDKKSSHIFQANSDYQNYKQDFYAERQLLLNHEIKIWDRLTWFFGILIALFGAGLGFFGWKTKKDINEKLENYKQESFKTFKEKLKNYIEKNEEEVFEMLKRYSEEFEILKNKRILVVTESENDVPQDLNKYGFNNITISSLEKFNETKEKELNYDGVVFDNFSQVKEKNIIDKYDFIEEVKNKDNREITKVKINECEKKFKGNKTVFFYYSCGNIDQTDIKRNGANFKSQIIPNLINLLKYQNKLENNNA